MTFPQNEKQTIQLYRIIQNRIGWHLVHLQIAFPDAVIENKRGQRLVVEFEFDSKNFHAHGHDPDGCDLIIAYTDSWENPPVPIWALEDCAKEEAQIIAKLLSGLEKELYETKKTLEESTVRYEWYEEDLEYFLDNTYEEIMFELALREVERQHGLPKFTLKHKYDWLPQTKQELRVSRTIESEQRDSPSWLEKVLATIILLVLIPAFVILLIAK